MESGGTSVPFEVARAQKRRHSSRGLAGGGGGRVAGGRLADRGTFRLVNATPDALPSLVELTPGEEKVLLQTLQFEAALPELLSAHAGRWIVWLDGVRSLHDSEAEAHAWAADNLPPDSGRLVVRVAARRPVVLSGIAAFRFGP